MCPGERALSDLPERAARVADAVLDEDRPYEKQLVTPLLEPEVFKCSGRELERSKHTKNHVLRTRSVQTLVHIVRTRRALNVPEVHIVLLEREHFALPRDAPADQYAADARVDDVALAHVADSEEEAELAVAAGDHRVLREHEREGALL